jgi:hypothetical protein
LSGLIWGPVMLVVLFGPLVFRLMREFFARQEAGRS